MVIQNVRNKLRKLLYLSLQSSNHIQREIKHSCTDAANPTTGIIQTAEYWFQLHFSLKDSDTFSKCSQSYSKLTAFEDNDSGKLPFKFY